MDTKSILALSVPLALGIAALSSAFALGKVVASAMDATGRQPEAATKILVNMTVGCAFIEAITIYLWVFAATLSGKF